MLTYFWEAVADYGGRRGRPRRSCRWKGLAVLGVCGGNAQSLIQGGVGEVLSPPTPSPEQESAVWPQACAAPFKPQFPLLPGRAMGLGGQQRAGATLALAEVLLGRMDVSCPAARENTVCSGPSVLPWQVSSQLTGLREAMPPPGSPP